MTLVVSYLYLTAAIVFEVGAALVARTAGAPVAVLLPPVRNVALLGVAALLLDRMVHVLALAAQAPL